MSAVEVVDGESSVAAAVVDGLAVSEYCSVGRKSEVAPVVEPVFKLRSMRTVQSSAKTVFNDMHRLYSAWVEGEMCSSIDDGCLTWGYVPRVLLVEGFSGGLCAWRVKVSWGLIACGWDGASAVM